MAGIEINGNKVLRTGVTSSMNRGFNSVSSNHISGLQSPTIDSLALTSGIRGYTPRSQQYNPGGGVQTLPRNPLDNNIHHSNSIQNIPSSNNTHTLPNRSTSQKIGNQLSSSPVPATSQQQILLKQKLSHQHPQQLTHQQLAQQQQLLHQQQLSQHQHQLSQQQLVQHQQQHHMKQLSQQQLTSQQMTSQQLLQQQILLRQLKPHTQQPTSQQSKQPKVLPGNNNSNSRNSIHVPQQQSVLPKPVSKAEQQPKSYKQAPATNSKQQPQISTQSSDGSNYMQALASISNQLPNKRPLTSAALSQLSAVTNQPSHSPTQLLNQPLSNQEQQEHQQLSNQAVTMQQQQQEQLSKQAVTLQQQQQEQLQLSKQAVTLKQQQEQLQQILEQQRIKDEEILMAKLQGVRLDTQTPQSQAGGQGSDRTYMNVQPVAAIGRGGQILNQPEVDKNVPIKGPDGGKKAPAIPKSQEVKHKKEPLYSTILQFNNNNNDANKIHGMHVFDDGVYANYAPASLYSNYSNYSELEALRSTDSQCSADEEPTVGLPNLDTDSPTSSSYSELRQAGGARVAFNGDGSIYEPVLPPKGIPGPNSIHFKSLSGGSTDSDYFGSCVKCGSKIVGDGSGCSAMGRLFHVQCFTCTECNIILQGLPFYAVEGSPLCETDYLNTLEKCCKCYQPILDRILRATGKPYHPTCFTCVACHKSLDGIPFTVDATNQIHCIEDFHKRFAPRCSVCKDPIMPTPGEEETVRVVALDRSFHINCYRCVDCNLLLSSDEDGRGCYPLDDTVLCRQCNTTRIQKLTSSIAQD